MKLRTSRQSDSEINVVDDASNRRLSPSRLKAIDVLGVAGGGLGARKLRTALSALGITIGIAAMVGVLGLSESSRADLAQEIEALGTNLLTVGPSSGFGGGDGTLPEETVVKIGRIGPVELVADVVTLDAAPRHDATTWSAATRPEPSTRWPPIWICSTH
jgi:putative ABC transport system permease protein